jgi:CRISPR type III-A-associated protein Csm2
MATITKSMLTEGIKDIVPLEEIGKYLAQKEQIPDLKKQGRFITKKEAMSSSQIRRFYGAIKRIQADFEHLKGEIILLEPKLAYAVGRDKNSSKINEFYKALSPLIREINEDETKFKNFVNITEAIVAYHKANGGD